MFLQNCGSHPSRKAMGYKIHYESKPDSNRILETMRRKNDSNIFDKSDLVSRSDFFKKQEKVSFK